MSFEVLKVQNLKMYYYMEDGQFVRAVDGISFSVFKGRTLGIVGESGCGKSSLAMTLIRILPANAKIVDGSIEILTERGYVDITKLSESELRSRIRWKYISIIPQGAMNALNPFIKIGDQIVEAILLHENISRREAEERAKNLLKYVNIDPSRFDSYPHELSGGQRQRVVIAMALATYPKVIIADEPTTALDVITQAQVIKLLKDLQAKFNFGLLFITHDLSLIAQVADYVAVMYAGKIVEYGPLDKVYNEPLHPYTKALLEAIPRLYGEKKRLRGIPGTPPDLRNPPPGCRFHPRCPYADEICKKEEPELRNVGEGRLVACHLV